MRVAFFDTVIEVAIFVVDYEGLANVRFQAFGELASGMPNWALNCLFESQVIPATPPSHQQRPSVWTSPLGQQAEEFEFQAASEMLL
jgi:hypothetical protein